MYFFRTFKKSTAPYKVHNMGRWYIKKDSVSRFFPAKLFDSFASIGIMFTLDDLPVTSSIGHQKVQYPWYPW